MNPPLDGSATFSLRLFGPMEVLVEGKPLPPVRSRKILWLLALLTLRHGRPVEREWLAGMLWPDADQSQAFASLRPVLSQLRTALGSQAFRVLSPNRHTLLLDLDGANVDVWVFDNAIASKRLDALECAVGVYHGSLLEGCVEEWVVQERETRAQECLRALQTLAENAYVATDYSAATGYWRRAVTMDPLGEVARRGLMETLAKTGDTNAALQVYREFLSVLQSTDPRAVADAETTALYRRLREETRNRAEIPAVTPNVEAQVFGTLPHAPTELVGREDERLEVVTALRRSRLVTLTGPGGIGKTRLAAAVAQESVREYLDGVWLVALDALPANSTSGEEAIRGVVQQVATLLGVKESTGRTLLPEVTERLRRKRLLLVLDNCEHVLAACAQLVARLLRECLGVRILATSREALRVTGETLWSVPALTVPDPAHLPTGRVTLARVLSGYDGVQLFVERAQAAQRHFALTGENAPEVASLCWRLEGAPLALELAAARTGLLTPAQILAQLDARPLDALASHQRDTAPRHRTLRATLEWSYGLLPPDAQTFLTNLGVFSGGWTLEAAQAVCPDSDAIEMLSVLQSANLINVVCDKEGNPRFTMLETVRQFAREALEGSGRANEVRRRHADYYARWEVRLEEKVWLFYDSVEREYANHMIALHWTLEAGELELLVRLCYNLGDFWVFAGRTVEGRDWMETVARKFQGQEWYGWDETQRSRYREKLIETRARLLVATSDWDGAVQLNLQIFEDNLRAGNPVRGRTALYNAGVYFLEFDLKKGLSILEQCIPLEKEASGDGRGNPIIYSQLAYITRLTGEPERATSFLINALELCQGREEKDPFGVAVALWKAGYAALEIGDLSLAQQRFEISATIGERFAAFLGLTNALCGLATLARIVGDLDKEEELLARATAAAGPEPRAKLVQRLRKEQVESLLARRNFSGAMTLIRESLTQIPKKAHAHRFYAYPLLLGLAEAQLASAAESCRAERVAHLLGAASGMATRLGLVMPERAERERIVRLRETLTTCLGVERLREEEVAGTARDDEATLEFALATG